MTGSYDWKFTEYRKTVKQSWIFSDKMMIVKDLFFANGLR